MKKTLLNFIISLFIILIPTILIIFTCSILINNGILQVKYGNMFITIFSIIFFFLFAFLFCKKQKSHGLLHGFILIIMYLAISLLLVNSQEINILIRISKCLALLFGSIIGVNYANN